MRTFAEAETVLEELAAEGAGVVELCGAFGAERAKALIERTNSRVGIGFVVHHPEQDELFARFFSKG